MQACRGRAKKKIVNTDRKKGKERITGVCSLADSPGVSELPSRLYVDLVPCNFTHGMLAFFGASLAISPSVRRSMI